MKQFNLEEYLKNPTRKVITRDGRSARIICIDAKSSGGKYKFPIVALIQNVQKDEEDIYTFRKDGTDTSRMQDLFFAPEKHEGWINIYRTKDDGLFSSNNIWATEEEAKRVKGGAYITTVKIEWDE